MVHTNLPKTSTSAIFESQWQKEEDNNKYAVVAFQREAVVALDHKIVRQLKKVVNMGVVAAVRAAVEVEEEPLNLFTVDLLQQIEAMGTIEGQIGTVQMSAEAATIAHKVAIMLHTELTGTILLQDRLALIPLFALF